MSLENCQKEVNKRITGCMNGRVMYENFNFKLN